MQQQFVDEGLIRTVNQGTPKLSLVAGDVARWRWELRVRSRASDDAVGNDADRTEFRFRDANNRIDVKAARASFPATWLTVNYIYRVQTWSGLFKQLVEVELELNVQCRRSS